MTEVKKLIAAVVLTGIFTPVIACAQDAGQKGGAGTSPYVSDLTNPDVPMQVQKDQITDYEPLVSPFTHAIELQGRNGLAYVSQNGRFVLRGVIFDTWTGKTVQTMEELRASKKSMNLAELGLKDADVDPMFFGTGPKKVTMFVDPLCPYCGQVFDQILGDPSYAKTYTFTIYTVPFLGDDSARAVNAISCATDREQAVMALLTKDRRWMMGHPAPDGCNKQPIVQRTILSQMIGVTGVPYIIGPEGGIARGLPADLATFLATN